MSAVNASNAPGPAANPPPPVGAASGNLDAARRFSIEVARLLATTRCHNVVVLDVSGISPVTDFLVIGTGTSPRQMRTVCDQAEEFGEANNFRPISRSGDDGSASWVVLDFVDVVLHVFSQDARSYYDLDNLWGDARRVQWEPSTSAEPQA